MGNTEKFDEMANNYDKPDRIHLAKVSSDAILTYLVDTKDRDAIDFGCGTGLVGMSLANKFKSILFLDTAPNMLALVDQKLSDANIRNGRTVCFDFESSEQSDIRADYVFMAQVLLHIKDYESVLKKLYDVMNDEGHLLIVDFNKNEKVVSDLVHNGFEQDALKEIVARIGYKDPHSKTIYDGTKLFMGQDASLFILHARK